MVRGDRAVGEVAAADVVDVGCGRGPHLGRRAVRNPLDRRHVRGGDLLLQVAPGVAGQVPAEAGRDHPGMHRARAHAPRPQQPVEFECEQDVRGLGRTVGLPRVVVLRGVLVVRVVPADPRRDVPGGAEVDHARALVEARHQQVGEQEVAEVVRPELELEAVGGARERGGHHAGVVHEHVDPRVSGPQFGGAGADRRERGQVQDRVLDAARQVRDRRPALVPVARGQHHAGAGPREHPRALVAEAGGATGDHDRAAGQVEAGDDLVGGAVGSERHGRLRP